MPTLGRITFVIGAVTVTLLAVGCAARTEPIPPTTAAAIPAPTPPAAPTWPDAAAVPGTSAPDAAGPALTPERIASEFTERDELKDVHFASGQVHVQRADLKTLDAAVAWLKANASQLVILEGYTDAAGPRSANVALAQRRAKWVMGYLVGHGVAASRITVVSRGEDGTLCADKSTSCQSRNRRVRFLARESENVQISASPSR